jgi:hypothetical protein
VNAEVRTWLAARVPPGRDLDRPELAELAAAIGAEPRFWADKVHHVPDERFYVQLHRDTHLDVWLICWLDSQKTGYHDHDVSSGGVHVCAGTLCEDRFNVSPDGLVHATIERHAGQTFHFDAAYIHGMRHGGGEPATSVHCYSPPLWRMGYYEPDENGSLCRSSLTYLDELAESATPRAGAAARSSD